MSKSKSKTNLTPNGESGGESDGKDNSCRKSAVNRKSKAKPKTQKSGLSKSKTNLEPDANPFLA